MLQLTLDPSLLSDGQPGTAIHEAALGISGLSWAKNVALPATWKTDITNAKKCFFPWEWQTPDMLRMYWVSKNGNDYETTGFNDLLLKPIASGFDDDKDIIRKHYEHVIGKTIFSSDPLNRIRENELVIDYSGGKNQELIIDDESSITKETKFLTRTIAQCTQKLAPLNQVLKLVFFAKKVGVTANTNDIGFVIFPFSSTPGSRWSAATIPTSIKIAVSAAHDHLHVGYTNVDDTPMTVYCPITPFPVKPASAQPIQLRDDKLKFLGHVNLEVNDIEDQGPELLDAAGKFFNIPSLFLNYISKRIKNSNDYDNRAIHCSSNMDIPAFEKWINNLNDFLWAVSRDTLGFGYRKEADNNSIAKRLVVQYCEDAKVAGISLGNEDARSIHELLLQSFQSWDTQAIFNITKWKDTVGQVCKTDDRVENMDRDLQQQIARLNPRMKMLITRLDLNLALPSPLPAPFVDPIDFRNAKISEWVFAWRSFLALLHREDILCKRILFEQWNELPLTMAKIELDALLDIKTASNEVKLIKRLLWFEKVFADQDELSSTQEKGIPVVYRDTLLKSFNASVNASEKEMTNDFLATIEKYVTERLNTPQKLFFPEVTAKPFENPPTGMADPLTWQDFIKTISLQEADCNLSVKKVIRDVFPTPPMLQIRVDKLETEQMIDNDDLNDEIAGHIVLMDRALKINETVFSNDWRYLNWARIKSIMVDKIEKPGMPSDYQLTSTDLQVNYLLPTFLPDADDHKLSFLKLSNEKLSLIAGHKNFADDDDKGEKMDGYFEYDFHEKLPGYGLWYGYNYKFSGFVALNSGVLPEAIREKPEVLNVPLMSPTLLGALPVPQPASYHHLRRVPVSKTRIGATRDINGKLALIALPKGLLPLAHELPEWKGNLRPLTGETTLSSEELASLAGEQIHYLLADVDKFNQKEITIQLKKPTTSIWNWYAWLGEKGKTKSLLADPSRTYQEIALTKDLNARKKRQAMINAATDEVICDPAVSQKFFIICLESLFPVKKAKEWAKVSHEDFDQGLLDPASLLTTKIGSDTKIGTATGNKIEVTIAPGHVARVHVYCLTDKSFFKDNGPEQRFHSWMNEVVAADIDTTKILNGDFAAFFLTKPVEMWFEAAKKPEFTPERLWRNLLVSHDQDKVNLSLNRVVNLPGKTEKLHEFAYASRIEVRHQVWSWNGRLDESDDYLDLGVSDPARVGEDAAGNGIFKTSEAMKWEAWSFSDRPDFSGLVSETTLAARRTDATLAEEQIIFTDRRAAEEKALYYRFSATVFSRYELLGGNLKNSIESKIAVIDKTKDRSVDHRWKRYLRKCSRIKQLPKPAIRFVIPLTKSIQESRGDNKVTAASLMVVLNDRWFTEAGLAEQLDIGVDLLENPLSTATIKERYLNAGNDPILSRNSLGSVQMDAPGVQDTVAIFTPKGPVGLTFDFVAQTPRLLGSAFILDLPDISKLVTTGGKYETNKLEPWSMMQIAARRRLRPHLCEPGLPVASMASEWTAKEWVQFLPSTDSFIPNAWRRNTAIDGHIKVKPAPQHLVITFEPGDKLPVFDPVFEEKMQRFAILTEKVYDIGGQPTERYVATYHYNSDNSFSLDKEDNRTNVLSGVKQGFVRLMLVRSRGTDHTGSIWKRLFGESATGRPDADDVEKDPTAALPLISERVPYKIG